MFALPIAITGASKTQAQDVRPDTVIRLQRTYFGATDSLLEFEREIDKVAGTKRWVFPDEDALNELERADWRASIDEGATLLQQAPDSSRSRRADHRGLRSRARDA